MGKKILVVEDEPLLREMICIILNDENFDTYQAEHGEEAVEILQNRPVDLVLSDISMPKMDGLDLGVYCKERFPEIPFVLMSGGSRELQVQDNDKYLDSGKELTAARYVLQKPFDLDDFLGIIQTCFPDDPV
jgi:CheY-like chemotaxis protein